MLRKLNLGRQTGGGVESGQWSEKSHGSVIRGKEITSTECLKIIIRHKDWPLFESGPNPHHIGISNTGNKMKNKLPEQEGNIRKSLMNYNDWKFQ